MHYRGAVGKHPIDCYAHSDRHVTGASTGNPTMTTPVELSVAAQRAGLHPSEAFSRLTKLRARGEKRGRRWYFEAEDCARLEAERDGEVLTPSAA